MADIQLSVVTPERTAIDTVADFVVVPFPDGEKGIGNHHSPLIARLGYGELRFESSGQTQRYYVDGGFVQVRDNRIVVLTGRVIAAGELDVDDARKRIDEAMKMAIVDDESLDKRDRLVEQARAQIKVAAH